MFLLKALILACVAALCQAEPLRFRGERDLEKETTVAKRKDESTEAGPISGTSEDSLYTHGLATCIGIGAVGNPPLIGSRIDKVLSHLTCEDADLDLLLWDIAMILALMSDVYIGVSVVDTELVDESLRNGMREYNRAALTRATENVPGETWRVKPIVRSSIYGSRPEGTMKIQANGDMYAEGNQISWPSIPTVNVDCYWPILYTPTNAPSGRVDEMRALADQICVDAGGCGDKPATCQTSNDSPAGYCECEE